MGCTGCGVARHASPAMRWNPNPLAGYGVGGWPRGFPAIGTVDTSVATAESPCCDACAESRNPYESDAGCASGACPTQTAGLKLPMDRRSGAVSLASAAELDEYAAAWARETGLTGTGFAREADGRVRQAGRVMPITQRPFVRSSLTDIRGMTNAVLDDRIFELTVVPGITTEQNAELQSLNQERDRRILSDIDLGGGTTGGGGGSADEDTPASELSAAEWEEKRRAIAEATAADLEPGDDARRAAIITRAMTGTFASFNAWLQANYRTEVETIRGNTAITLATLGYDDRERQRQYNLARPQVSSTSDSGGGVGTAAVGLGLVAAVVALARS